MTEYLSIKQVADLLGVTYRTVYKEIMDGKLGYTQVRSRYLIHEIKHLEPYLKKNTHQAKREPAF